MKQRKIDRILLGCSIFCFTAMSASFLLMPVDAVGILPGLLFWLGLCGGITLQIILEARRRRFFQAYQVKRRKMQKPRNGLLSFGSNREAILADSALGVSLIGAILAFVLTEGYGYICYVFITTTLLSFCLHCIFNGRIYFHAKNQLKIRQVLETKNGKKSEEGEGEQ